MAIVEMEKMRLIALESERALIIEKLAASGTFEVKSIDGLTEETENKPLGNREKYLSLKARTAYAISALNDSFRLAKQLNKKSNAFSVNEKESYVGKVRLSREELVKISYKEQSLLEVVGKIENLVTERTENKAERNRLKSDSTRTAAWLRCKDKFSDFEETEQTFSLLISGKPAKELDEVLETSGTLVVNYGGSPTQILGIVCQKANRKDVENALSRCGWTICPLNYPETAEEHIAVNEQKTKDLEIKDNGIVSAIIGYMTYLKDLKILHDYYLSELEKCDAEALCGYTESTFIIEGWVPKEDNSLITEKVNEVTDIVDISSRKVEEDDKPPTLYKKSALLSPFQALTNQYSPVSYFEPDPNIFTAFFFFIFFGMMTADAGYGLILAIGSVLLLKILKPSMGMANLVKLIGICSISAVIWGLLFGSVFGFDFGNSDFGFGLLNTPEGYTAGLWFNPLEEPLLLLLLCLVIGAVHMLCGYCIAFYKHMRKGEWTAALFDDGFLIVTYVGVIMIMLAMGINLFNLHTHTWGNLGTTPLLPEGLSVLMIPGLITMGAGLLGTVLTKGRAKKGIAGKIITGLSGIYGIVNILSDVLSYARIFGIALASCAIGYAFNILVGMVGGAGGVAVVLAAILAIVLHAFNLAMGTLSAYVHNARLQYLEFYGKFYEGNGREFKPLGWARKFTQI